MSRNPMGYGIEVGHHVAEPRSGWNTTREWSTTDNEKCTEIYRRFAKVSVILTFLLISICSRGDWPSLTQNSSDELREKAGKVMMDTRSEIPSRQAQILVPQPVLHMWGSNKLLGKYPI